MQKETDSPILIFIMNNPKQESVIYVTRDIERALSYESESYVIISNSTSYAKSMAKNRTDIVLVDTGAILDTRELLQHPVAVKYIESQSAQQIVIFKNTLAIERICKERGWNLLNPPAELSNLIEEKISQVEWLGELSHYLPPHKIDELENITWADTPVILQFNRAHTGSGTLYIENKTQLEALQKKHPKRPVRVTDYIEGDAYTINIVIDKHGTIIPGSWSFQITGLSPFTSQEFATVGNDWNVSAKLDGKILQKMNAMVRDVGAHMHNAQWLGLFGIDVIVDTSGKVFLIEINARQPASTSYESHLQKKKTLFEAHIAALCGESLKKFKTTPVENGAQIVLRNQEGVEYDIETIATHCEKMNLHVISYEQNNRPGSDALRIQHKHGLMDDAHTPNKMLNEIADVIQKNTKKLSEQTQDNKSKTIAKIARHSGSLSTKESVSEKTKHIIKSYKHLSFGAQSVQCPYFNNKRTRLRGALPALIGKGSPEEITEEAKLLALRQKIDLSKLDAQRLKDFLVDNNLGIDCSGYAYYLLDAEVCSHGLGTLKKYIQFKGGGLIRRIIRRFRTIENINVKVLAGEKNSFEIELKHTKPGDFVVIIDSGNDFARDHVLFITDVEYKNDIVQKIIYTHTFQWTTDGKYNHGVRDGEIKISDPSAELTKQEWIEQSVVGKNNETLRRAQNAKRVEVRRLRIMNG